MVTKAWGAYGVLWPVLHQWLGVAPDLGRDRVAVVPQLPAGQPKASANSVKLGVFTIDVAAAHQGSTYTTTVTRHGRTNLRIEAVLPDGATVASATLTVRRSSPSWCGPPVGSKRPSGHEPDNVRRRW